MFFSFYSGLFKWGSLNLLKLVVFSTHMSLSLQLPFEIFFASIMLQGLWITCSSDTPPSNLLTPKNSVVSASVLFCLTSSYLNCTMTSLLSTQYYSNMRVLCHLFLTEITVRSLLCRNEDLCRLLSVTTCSSCLLHAHVFCENWQHSAWYSDCFSSPVSLIFLRLTTFTGEADLLPP